MQSARWKILSRRKNKNLNLKFFILKVSMDNIKKIIKQAIFISLIFLFGFPVLHAQDIAGEAGEAFNSGDYEKAIGLLENEAAVQKEKGLESSKLYYNLGNAYFRSNDLAKALLYYEKALLLNPGDGDTKLNIEYAKTLIEDKIVEVDTFFLQSWFEGIQNLQGSNAWAKLSVVLFIILILALGAFFFSRYISIKKVAFYLGVTLFVLLIFTNIFAYRQKSKITNRDTAIIMAGSVPVVNSPGSNAKELFILHSGTKVKITKTDGNWMEIEIANGNIGWVTTDKLEII